MKGREREEESLATPWGGRLPLQPKGRDKRGGRGSRGVTKEDLLSLVCGFLINCRVMEPQGLEEEAERDWELSPGI